MASPRLAGPYARVYDRYINDWHEFGLEVRVLLKLCERVSSHSNTSGEVLTVSYGRERMAEELGVTPKQVSDAVRRLKAKGYIKTCEPGQRGRQAVYYLMPEIPWPLNKGGRGEPGHSPQAGGVEPDPRWDN